MYPSIFSILYGGVIDIVTFWSVGKLIPLLVTYFDGYGVWSVWHVGVEPRVAY